MRPPKDDPAAPESHEQGSRRVEITVEREILSISYRTGASFFAQCPTCNREVLMLTARAASEAASVTPRQIYRWIEKNMLHFYEATAGEVFICSDSLHRLKQSPNQPTPLD